MLPARHLSSHPRTHVVEGDFHKLSSDLRRHSVSNLHTQINKLISVEKKGSGMVVHAFNPAPQKQRQAKLCEFTDSLVYIASYRPARGT